MTFSQSYYKDIYAPKDIEEIEINRRHAVTRFSVFGENRITMILGERFEVVLPRNISSWFRKYGEEFLKLQEEARNSRLFIMIERNHVNDIRIHFKREFDSLLFPCEMSDSEDSDDERDPPCDE
ncbi:hypothetical protein QAD02_013547 [Eretmocerus hayati]|uniref:Uncharacterized protein n=1 Tax=Eretmocerus hayati TaxID=131215 RepID=A0ACC2P7K2_9HYME|nr:hypothetical protein QAD02_013547 [Eretmocerus hayati]